MINNEKIISNKNYPFKIGVKMKYSIAVSLLFLLSIFTFAQGDEFCYTDETQLSLPLPRFGPNGTLRTLVVICKFQEENYVNLPYTALWPPEMNYIPPWAPGLISSTIQSDYPDPSIQGLYPIVSRLSDSTEH